MSIRRDEAAQCVLEALQDCMARYLDREYLARHLRPPEAAAHRQEQLALRAARLEQALARQRACRKTLYEDRVDGAVTAAQFAELSAAFEAEIARLGKELAAAERERGAAAEQAAQCVTAEPAGEKICPGRCADGRDGRMYGGGRAGGQAGAPAQARSAGDTLEVLTRAARTQRGRVHMPSRQVAFPNDGRRRQ